MNTDSAFFMMFVIYKLHKILSLNAGRDFLFYVIRINWFHARLHMFSFKLLIVLGYPK